MNTQCTKHTDAEIMEAKLSGRDCPSDSEACAYAPDVMKRLRILGYDPQDTQEYLRALRDISVCERCMNYKFYEINQVVPAVENNPWRKS